MGGALGGDRRAGRAFPGYWCATRPAGRPPSALGAEVAGRGRLPCRSRAFGAAGRVVGEVRPGALLPAGLLVRRDDRVASGDLERHERAVQTGCRSHFSEIRSRGRSVSVRMRIPLIAGGTL